MKILMTIKNRCCLILRISVRIDNTGIKDCSHEFLVLQISSMCRKRFDMGQNRLKTLLIGFRELFLIIIILFVVSKK